MGNSIAMFDYQRVSLVHVLDMFHHLRINCQHHRKKWSADVRLKLKMFTDVRHLRHNRNRDHDQTGAPLCHVSRHTVLLEHHCFLSAPSHYTHLTIDIPTKGKNMFQTTNQSHYISHSYPMNI